MVKSLIMVCALALPLCGCQHIEQEIESKMGSDIGADHTSEIRQNSRLTDAEIRDHIDGEWILSKKSDAPWYSKMILAGDGTVTVATAQGAQAVLGTWECQDQTLRLTPNPDFVRTEQESGSSITRSDNFYRVIHINDHELVLEPGLSVAGKLRFKKSEPKATVR